MSPSVHAFLTLAISFLVAQKAVADAPKRVALVIGNSQYEVGPLVNPSNDADSIAEVLNSFGFAVTKKKDLTKSQTEAAVDAVTDNLQRGDMCLIFYAGHGMQMAEQNYLVPLGAQLTRPQHVQERCVTVSYLLNALRFSECSLKVVVIDACRNNPFRSLTRSTRSGLLKLDGAPEGTLVSFSTSPKTTALDGQGSNSPFAKHLTSVMRTKGDTLEIVRLFREASRAVKNETGQVPYLEFDATMPDFFLNSLGTLPPTKSAPKMKVKPSGPATREPITNEIGMKLRLIPAADFMMGSPLGEEDRYDDEQQHRVWITKPFYLQTTEVTQGQWQSVMGTEPWKGENEVRVGYDYPATYVSWNDAVEFCERLSRRTGEPYRLPTEAEWEYACRGGSSRMYSFGDSAGQLGQYSWFDSNAAQLGERYAHRVSQKQPNDFGLYDMHGNVREWCSDWYSEDYYGNSPRNDPPGASGGLRRVNRGSSWFGSPPVCRSAYRDRDTPSNRRNSLGFRVVRSSVE